MGTNKNASRAIISAVALALVGVLLGVGAALRNAGPQLATSLPLQTPAVQPPSKPAAPFPAPPQSPPDPAVLWNVLDSDGDSPDTPGCLDRYADADEYCAAQVIDSNGDYCSGNTLSELVGPAGICADLNVIETVDYECQDWCVSEHKGSLGVCVTVEKHCPRLGGGAKKPSAYCECSS